MCEFMEKLKQEEDALLAVIEKAQSDLEHTRGMMAAHQNDAACVDSETGEQEYTSDGLVIPAFTGNVLSQDMKMLLQNNPDKTFTCDHFIEIFEAQWKKRCGGVKKFRKKVWNAAGQVRTVEEVNSKKIGKSSYMRWEGRPTIKGANHG